MKILPSIVTTNGNYFRQLREAEELGVKGLCLFLTGLNEEQRKKFYPKLGKSSLEKIPFVHLRSDMNLDELNFFSERFKTYLFNIHPLSLFPLENDLTYYKDNIYIENSDAVYDDEEIRKFAGICIDFTHLEADRLLENDTYNKNMKAIKKYSCGCGHISAIKKVLTLDPKTKKYQYDFHYLSDFSEIDYLEKFVRFFPPVIAMELENTLENQLKIIDYLSKKSWFSKP